MLIVTDAAVDEFPDSEFAALNQRNIVPYIIYINTSDARTAMIGHPSTPRLIEMIREYGGDYFDVTDEDSLTEAYQALTNVKRCVSNRNIVHSKCRSIHVFFC
ncbi:MAG: hypothetical protein Ct9H300mP25_06920 [Acidobacteriota bacterium]|nr:MAG: hypothetical protein Ct9H300mP25_06920 [Acidobacteriota bacterium]